jgi:lipopolysaccharide export system permease protein
MAYFLIRNRINPSLKWWRRQLPSFLANRWIIYFPTSLNAT